MDGHLPFATQSAVATTALSARLSLRNAALAAMFPDLRPALTPQEAVVEADRCLNCFDAPCTAACPTHIDVPRFIKKIESGNLLGSAHTILEANVLGASCARVCPVEVLCEGSCVMHGLNRKPIEIGRLQRHAMDAFHAFGGALPGRPLPVLAGTQRGKEGKVACIGAGPASLAAAAELCQRGFAVTVFDKRALPGGLNTYGVAEYKLRAEDSLREVQLIADLGVEFRLGVGIADATALRELEREFDRIFLGVGLGPMHRLAFPGGDHPAVLDALRFIEEYKLGLRTSVSGTVAVIGAGNTAVDAACAAKRLGAAAVHILYRRTERDISAFAAEYDHALREGVQFHWRTQPVAVYTESDRLQGLECVAMSELPGGELVPSTSPATLFLCDLVIPAIGQSPLLDLLTQVTGLRTERGRIVADPVTGATSNPQYFAGGDCANGGREVVDAVAEGKRAAIAIAHDLEAAHA